MCFSAGASFGAGVMLSAIGVASIKNVRSPSHFPFASIPLIFAAQQITEGFLWLASPEPTGVIIHRIATYVFIFFAQVVWPTWVPFSIMNIERNEKRKKVLKLLAGIGFTVSLYLAYCLLKYPVQAVVVGRHISYVQEYPAALSKYGGLLYLIATIAPPFFSSAKRMWALGLSILISYVITTVYYEGYIVSVWCFFASIISIMVFAVLRAIKKSPEKVLVSR